MNRTSRLPPTFHALFVEMTISSSPSSAYCERSLILYYESLFQKCSQSVSYVPKCRLSAVTQAQTRTRYTRIVLPLSRYCSYVLPFFVIQILTSNKHTLKAVTSGPPHLPDSSSIWQPGHSFLMHAPAHTQYSSPALPSA